MTLPRIQRLGIGFGQSGSTSKTGASGAWADPSAVSAVRAPARNSLRVCFMDRLREILFAEAVRLLPPSGRRQADHHPNLPTWPIQLCLAGKLLPCGYLPVARSAHSYGWIGQVGRMGWWSAMLRSPLSEAEA